MTQAGDARKIAKNKSHGRKGSRCRAYVVMRHVRIDSSFHKENLHQTIAYNRVTSKTDKISGNDGPQRERTRKGKRQIARPLFSLLVCL